jgi:hypothetical protein
MASVGIDPIPTAQPEPEPARAEPAAGTAAVPAGWTLPAGVAGLAGGAALGASFGLLPSPPPITAPLAVLARYAAAHQHALLAAGWLEGTGTLLQVIYEDDGNPLVAVEHLARLNPRAGAEALRAVAWDGSADDGLCLEAAGKPAELCW